MENYGTKLKLSIGLLFFTIALVLLSLRSDAATPPSIISYQGKILQNGVSASTSLTMTFELFNTSTGGAILYTTTNAVTPSSGLFSVLLGGSGTTPLNSDIFRYNDEMYLQVTVEGQVLLPRKRIVTVPYAFNAKYLDGYGVSLTPTNTNYIPVADSDGGFTFGNVTTTGNLSVSGTINAGQICDANGENCHEVANNLSAIFVGLTSATKNGDFTTGSYRGYVAANKICQAQYPGSHFCTTDEILNTISAKESELATLFVGGSYGWLAEGPPGYTANANDCVGWTSSSSVNTYGPFWIFNTSTGGEGYLSPCGQQRNLSCCK